MPGFNIERTGDLSHLRIALAGTGAIGSTVAELLVQAGASSVLLIDPQQVEDRNLATSPFLRQALDDYTPGCTEARQYKASLLAREAARLGAVGWTAITAEIGDVGWQALAACDAIVCCTDSALSRVEAAYTARMLGKPMLEAGVMGQGEFRCRYSYFPAALDTACYLCGLREDRRAQVLAHAASPTLGCAPLAESPSMTGALATVRHAAEGLMTLLERLANRTLPNDVALVWRCVGMEDKMGTVQWQDEPLQPALSKTCPWHDPSLDDLTELPWDTPVDEALRSKGACGSILQLAWALCIAARCTQCGGMAKPFQRLAFVRRCAACPHCGKTGVLQPERTSEALAPGDPLRALSPRQLGQPPYHLYLLRKAMFCSQHVESVEKRELAVL